MAEQKVSGGVLGCAVLTALLVVLGAVKRCDEPDTRNAGSAPAPPQLSARSRDDAEADDALAALRVYWPTGLQVAKAEGAWADCHDELKGYGPYLKCLTESYSAIFAARRRLDDAPHAALSCGKEIEAAHREYIDAQLQLFDHRLNWTKGVRAELSVRMANATIGDACEPEVACKGQPFAGVAGETAVDYSRIMGVDCTKRLFRCDQADNVCWINKVAARLNLGPDKPGGLLFVRSGGRRLN